MLAEETKLETTLRSFEEKDHALLAQWWEGHGWPTIPLSSLPMGLICEVVGQPVVAGFLYLTDSDIAIMEWLISDPKSSPFIRSHALDQLIDGLCVFAKQAGARIVFSFFKQPRLVARAESLGFKQTDSGMTHLVKEL